MATKKVAGKSVKKAVAKKTSAKKTAAKKTVAKKTVAKKSAAKKSASKKTAKKSAKTSATRKYSLSASKRVETEMRAMQRGKLKSGRGGKTVTNPKQAIAIGLSEARKAGEKVPPNPNQ